MINKQLYIIFQFFHVDFFFFQMVEESALQLGNLDLTSEDFLLDEVDGECCFGMVGSLKTF